MPQLGSLMTISTVCSHFFKLLPPITHEVRLKFKVFWSLYKIHEAINKSVNIVIKTAKCVRFQKTFQVKILNVKDYKSAPDFDDGQNNHRNCRFNDNVMSSGYTQIKLCALCSVITSVDEKIIDKKAKA